MINTLLGIKRDMTSTYDSRGRRVGATIVEIKPNIIVQTKTSEGKDGYDALQLGTGSKKSVRKPQLGHVKKAGLENKIRWFREVRVEEQEENLKPGTEIKMDQVFSRGDAVKVSGISKGKGFQGGVRRHGFHGGSRTHGQSDRLRAPGAIGSGTTPGRVYKGKRMAGHMGSEQVSVKNLEVVGLDKTNSLLLVKGAVPGPVGALVVVTKLGRIKGYTPPPEEKPEEGEEETSKSEGQQVSESAEAEKVESADTAETPTTETPKEGEENAG